MTVLPGCMRQCACHSTGCAATQQMTWWVVNSIVEKSVAGVAIIRAEHTKVWASLFLTSWQCTHFLKCNWRSPFFSKSECYSTRLLWMFSCNLSKLTNHPLDLKFQRVPDLCSAVDQLCLNPAAQDFQEIIWRQSVMPLTDKSRNGNLWVFLSQLEAGGGKECLWRQQKYHA